MPRRLNATDAYLIMNNLVEQATGEQSSIAEGDVSAYISAGGPLDTGDNYFEERPAQIELLKKICTSFNEEGVGVFEAGTASRRNALNPQLN